MGSETQAQGDRVRVLHLISDAGPHPYFELIGAHTDRERFDVRLASVGPSGALQDAAERMDLESLALGARGRGGYPKAVLDLARRLRRERIDVLHTHLLDASIVGLLAGRLARTPLTVFTGHHSHEVPLHDRRLLTAVDRLSAGPLSDLIISPSQQMKDTLIDVYGTRPEKVEVVHHGFELSRLDPDRVDGSAVRAELGLEGKLVFGSIGRFFWVKNQEALVRGFTDIAERESDARLLLIGGGEPGPVRGLADELGLADRVVIAPRRPDVPELLATMDVFVHPALAESFGMVIVEAMAMALPIVTTPVGIAPEVVVDSVSGIVAADGSAEGLRDALTRTLAARERWQAMGAEARVRALTFPAAKMVAAYEDLYASSLATGGR